MLDVTIGEGHHFTLKHRWHGRGYRRQNTWTFWRRLMRTSKNTKEKEIGGAGNWTRTAKEKEITMEIRMLKAGYTKTCSEQEVPTITYINQSTDQCMYTYMRNRVQVPPILSLPLILVYCCYEAVYLFNNESAEMIRRECARDLTKSSQKCPWVQTHWAALTLTMTQHVTDTSDTINILSEVEAAHHIIRPLFPLATPWLKWRAACLLL